MHPDHSEYIGYFSRANLIKSIESIAGLITGIDIDREINQVELGFLYDWVDSHDEVRHRHPYNEILPVVVGALEDGILTEEEKEDLLWLCKRLTDDTEHANDVTASMRTLHGILGGIVADSVIGERELDGLRLWLDDHDHMRTIWPYDEIDALVTAVMSDRQITSEEHTALLGFFAAFVDTHEGGTVSDAPYSDDGAIVGVCAMCPEIAFESKLFCLTGASAKYVRRELVSMIEEAGGSFSNTVNRKTDYLVVGADGNPCWAYACYGRKVEQAVKLRKQGYPVRIVHEHDFRDALADAGVTA